MGIRSRLLLTLPLAAIAIGGCGGGGGSDSTAAAPATTTEAVPLSKEELIAQGDAICAEVNAAVGTVSSTTGSGAASQRVQEADLYNGMVERLKGLGQPAEGSGYQEFIGAAEELAQAESDAKLAAERGEEGALTEAESRASSALGSFQSAAQAYGFEECGEAPSAPSTGSGSEEASEESSAGSEEEAAPESEPAPETGGAGTGAGGGAEVGGGGAEGGGESSGGSSSGGIGPG